MWDKRATVTKSTGAEGRVDHEKIQHRNFCKNLGESFRISQILELEELYKFN